MSQPISGSSPVRRRVVVATATALALVSLGGCSVAEDVTQRAGDAAKSEASRALSDAVQDQICGAVGDGVVNSSDLTLLRALLGKAADSGLPADVMGPLRQVAADGQKATDAVDNLQRTCSGRT